MGTPDGKRGGTRRRVVGKRRTVGGAGRDGGRTLALDDQPRELVITRDGHRILVVLPYEIWVVDARTFSFERSLELPCAEPSVAEGRDGRLWIGGHHLYAGSAFDPGLAKVGTKLGGFVDQVALLRPGLLCGVGSGGEVLFDLDAEKEVHRRKVRERRTQAVIATPDERAVFCDGAPSAWMIDPAHPSGHTKLGFASTSPSAPTTEGVVRVGLTTRGRCVLGSRDGAIAWTSPGMRRAGERWAPLPAGAASPLAIAGDERWVYVLRPGGRLQRFLVEQPPEVRAAEAARQGNDKKGRRKRHDRPRTAPGGDEDAPEPLPELQETRLARVATCMTLRCRDDDDAAAKQEAAPSPRRALVLGGPHADGLLGRLWEVDVDAIEWSDVRPRPRPVSDGPTEPPPSGASGSSRPDFTPMRHKLGDAAGTLSTMAVDAVLAPPAAGPTSTWITHDRGTLIDRPWAALATEEVRPLDVVLLPAMVRMREGTVRPAMALWGAAREDRDDPAPDLIWLTWGDRPRGWLPLITPKIREQRWSRAALFPMTVALRGTPDVPGRRAKIPKRWIDPDAFEAMATECRKLMKVLW